jgi:hypothetical protein
MTIPLASKDVTMTKPWMYLCRKNLNKTSLALMVTSEFVYIFCSFIIKSIYAVFRFVSWHDRIFILFLLVTWPEYLFLKNKFQIPFRIKWPSPKKHIGVPRDERVSFFCARLLTGKRILNLTEDFQISPCDFSFYHVL